MAQTAEQIQQELLNSIVAKRPDVDMSEGEILHDIVVVAPSAIMAEQASNLDKLNTNLSLLDADYNALSNTAQNLGLVPKQATPSYGVVSFYRSTAPTSDIVIPINTRVAVVSNGVIIAAYTTTMQRTMYFGQANSYLQTTGNVTRYAIDIPIQSESTGANTSTGVGTITSLLTSIPGIVGCYNNIAVSGGYDAESIDDLRLRIAARYLGSSEGNSMSFINLFGDISEVSDIVVQGGVNSARQEFGAIDIYVKGQRVKQYSEVFEKTGLIFSPCYLTKQPLMIDSVVNVLSTVNVATTDYTISRDALEYGGSTRGLDNVQITNPSISVAYLTYTYNSLIEDLQKIVDDIDLLNTSVLVFQATPITVNITISVAVLNGFDVSIVTDDIENAVIAFFSQSNIGQEIQQADIARVILEVPGVDDVTLPFTLLEGEYADGTKLAASVINNLSIPNKYYATLGTLTIGTR